MTKVTRTGGVMVKEPKYWFKWTKTGKKLKLQIADGPVEGFHVDPVNMDRGDGLGELDHSYIGRYHCGSNWKSAQDGFLPIRRQRHEIPHGNHGGQPEFLWVLPVPEYRGLVGQRVRLDGRVLLQCQWPECHQESQSVQ